MATHVIDEFPPTPGDGGDALAAWTRALREKSPVWFNKAVDVWHVFDYATTQRVLSDTSTFSSDMSAVAPATLFIKSNFMRMDPPEHRKYRALIGQAFNARTVEGLRPRIADITRSLLDAVGRSERFDISNALSFPLPVTVISELLGVPPSDRALFRTWADDMFSANFEKPFDRAVVERLEAAVSPMHAYLMKHVRDRRSAPREDLISRVVKAEVDGQRLDDEDAVTFAALLFIAGHVTTLLLVNNAVRCLDANPRIFAELIGNPAGIPAIVEETLRFYPPFLGVPRLTTTEVHLCGERIPAGSVVVPSLLSANRDPARFPDPDRFAPGRHDKHVAFGHGIHFCLGASLARLEAEVALSMLVDRYRDIRLNDEEAPEFYLAQGVLGPKQLPVRVWPNREAT
ncbi:cytochrome P450 [Streptomyces sp. NPDC127084]|uniref:cytochrome P450 n=1 Tax=Streptomyces sp. NPDC127084 TaxID=3347133 RepID=UPI00365C3A12